MKRLLAALAYILPIVPLVAILRPLYTQAPTLQKDAGDVLGFGALLCLLACLAITPMQKVTGMKQASKWRKWFGLWVFVLGGAGLIIAIIGGPMGLTQWAIQRPAGHVQEWTGTLMVFLLIPLAITSNKMAQRWLGAHWKTWQRRLMWSVWAVLVIHLAVLRAWTAEISYLMVSGPLIVARIPDVRNDVNRWRRNEYIDSHLWILLGITTAVSIFGLVVLSWMEVKAIGKAVNLT